MFLRVASAAAFALGLLAPRPAAGNGRLPGASQLVFSVSPGTAGVAVLRTTFGILVSRDAGATWDWVCEAAIPGLQSGVDPAIGLTANGTLVATVFPGLDLSTDTGCSWRASGCPFRGLLAVDVAVRPDALHAVVAVVSSPTASSGTKGASACPSASFDGGEGLFDNRVIESRDDGAHWAALGASLDPGVVITTIDVAATDPHRVYASAFREVADGDGGAAREASLFVSYDDGAHWTEQRAPLDRANESAVFIAAVDPADADRVYLRTAGGPRSPSRLLVTRDAGRTFESPLTLTGPMLGFALSGDGATVHAGSVENGLFAAPRASLAFEKRSAIAVTCLATNGADLWACSTEQSGFLAGVSRDDGATFTPKLHLCSLRGALSCPAGASAAQCSASFDFLDKGFGCRSDAGVADVDTGGVAAAPAVPSPGAPRGSCGCSAASRADLAGLLAPAALTAALAWRRARARGGRGAPGRSVF